uniref:Replication region DNA-binding N-term n=1 Tax=Candidatus Kentrum sp. FM TaxID=2126340 RepID=A0A450U354_9GAMM|nr:MAG: replication region DNA-binding N-term [Candidatus Kentron sp. FM]VFJ77571.1 MAG: replication region DNA-binding N-term [Candidatus Kentron sp. FM]
MGRPGITEEQVIQAANELQEEGIRPTTTNVQERIGSGSYSTVGKTLAKWREENKARTVAEIPPMPDKVQKAFDQAWAAAIRQTREDMETERQAFDARRREFEKERHDMAVEIERLEGVLEETEGKAAGFQEELGREREINAKGAEKLSGLKLENARLEERLKASEARAEELRGQLQSLQMEMARIAERSGRPAG